MSSRSKKRRIEIIILVLVMVVGAVFVGARFYMQSKLAKEAALMDQLQAVRTSVQLYLTMNKTMPRDLKVLSVENYTLGDSRNQYLTGVNVDRDGFPVDVFGNRFGYDGKNGKVQSVTKGYLDW